ncbi:MAG: hypothetical protein ACK5MZ_00740 [Aestuariibaculum sp.]
MKTYFFTTILCLFLANTCQVNKEKQEKDFIKSFVDNILIKKNQNQQDWNDYLELNNNLSEEKKEILNVIIRHEISVLNETLYKNDNKFRILGYKELKHNSLTPNLKLDSLDDVYFLTSNNRILVPIIIKNKKIISFSYGMTKNTKYSYPLLLNGQN